MSSFGVPRVNVIASDEGFSVEVLGRTGLLYRRGGRSLRIDSEVLAPPGAIAVYGNSIMAWEPPHESDRIDDAERSKILDDVARAFASQGHGIDVF